MLPVPWQAALQCIIATTSMVGCPTLYCINYVYSRHIPSFLSCINYFHSGHVAHCTLAFTLQNAPHHETGAHHERGFPLSICQLYCVL